MGIGSVVTARQDHPEDGSWIQAGRALARAVHTVSRTAVSIEIEECFFIGLSSFSTVLSDSDGEITRTNISAMRRKTAEPTPHQGGIPPWNTCPICQNPRLGTGFYNAQAIESRFLFKEAEVRVAAEDDRG